MLNSWVGRVGARVRPYVTARSWTSVLGLGRTLLALGTLATLLATPAPVLLSPLAGGVRPPTCSGLSAASVWCVVPSDGHAAAKWISVAVLVLVASGWRPMFTAIPHWWVSWSFITSATVQDGGDQITAVLTLLLVPLALTDPRRWHWSRSAPSAGETRTVIASVAVFLIKLQVMALYLHAGLSKFGVTEWVDGTAIFYWFRSVIFGAPPLLRPALDLVTDVPALVALVTWGAILIEIALGVALFLSPRAQYALLASGLLFHDAIAVCMGLWSFDLAMSAALILYLTPPGAQLTSPRRWPLVRRFRRRAAATSRTAPSPRPVTVAAVAGGGTPAGPLDR